MVGPVKGPQILHLESNPNRPPRHPPSHRLTSPSSLRGVQALLRGRGRTQVKAGLRPSPPPHRPLLTSSSPLRPWRAEGSRSSPGSHRQRFRVAETMATSRATAERETRAPAQRDRERATRACKGSTGAFAHKQAGGPRSGCGLRVPPSGPERQEPRQRVERGTQGQA